MSTNNAPNENQVISTEIVNDKINDVVALNQLINVIVDYYSFTNKLSEDEDDEKWKASGEESVIPDKVHTIIEKTFVTQLNKFVQS